MNKNFPKTLQNIVAAVCDRRPSLICRAKPAVTDRRNTEVWFRSKFIQSLALVMLSATIQLLAQSPGVPIIREGHGDAPELLQPVKALRDAGALLSIEKVREQLARKTCELTLLKPSQKKLAGREIWERARKAHLRVGWYFLCNNCSNWHLNLAGGYALTSDGAVATCYHVVEPKDMREGYLIAVTEAGKPLAITEILAANKIGDSCIVRVKSDEPLSPLSLNPTVHPGDDAWCYSDPLGRPGYFSKGIVNRFYQHWHNEQETGKFPVWMNVSTDWAQGSSGAAVLDEFGNAIGHVSEISAHGEADRPGAKDGKRSGETLIVFHNAVRAAAVLTLVKPKVK